jgi:hypothetical protein
VSLGVLKKYRNYLIKERIFKMKDRFDLENEISFLHNFSENLKTISEGILEHDLSRDEIVNAIEGIRVLLELQANKLLDTMTQCFKLDEYKDAY